MGCDMRFVLPIPPSDNCRYIIARGRLINSRAFREYKEMAQLELWSQRNDQIKNSPDLNYTDFPLKLSFEMQYPVKITVFAKDKRRDMTNIQKCLFDCMTGIIFNDDRWVLPRYERIVIDKNDPRVIIEI